MSWMPFVECADYRDVDAIDGTTPAAQDSFHAIQNYLNAIDVDSAVDSYLDILWPLLDGQPGLRRIYLERMLRAMAASGAPCQDEMLEVLARSAMDIRPLVPSAASFAAMMKAIAHTGRMDMFSIILEQARQRHPNFASSPMTQLVLLHCLAASCSPRRPDELPEKQQQFEILLGRLQDDLAPLMDELDVSERKRTNAIMQGAILRTSLDKDVLIERVQEMWDHAPDEELEFRHKLGLHCIAMQTSTTFENLHTFIRLFADLLLRVRMYVAENNVDNADAAFGPVQVGFVQRKVWQDAFSWSLLSDQLSISDILTSAWNMMHECNMMISRTLRTPDVFIRGLLYDMPECVRENVRPQVLQTITTASFQVANPQYLLDALLLWQQRRPPGSFVADLDVWYECIQFLSKPSSFAVLADQPNRNNRPNPHGRAAKGSGARSARQSPPNENGEKQGNDMVAMLSQLAEHDLKGSDVIGLDRGLARMASEAMDAATSPAAVKAKIEKLVRCLETACGIRMEHFAPVEVTLYAGRVEYIFAQLAALSTALAGPEVGMPLVNDLLQNGIAVNEFAWDRIIRALCVRHRYEMAVAMLRVAFSQGAIRNPKTPSLVMSYLVRGRMWPQTLQLWEESQEYFDTHREVLGPKSTSAGMAHSWIVRSSERRYGNLSDIEDAAERAMHPASLEHGLFSTDVMYAAAIDAYSALNQPHNAVRLYRCVFLHQVQVLAQQAQVPNPAHATSRCPDVLTFLVHKAGFQACSSHGLANVLESIITDSLPDAHVSQKLHYDTMRYASDLSRSDAVLAIYRGFLSRVGKEKYSKGFWAEGCGMVLHAIRRSRNTEALVFGLDTGVLPAQALQSRNKQQLIRDISQGIASTALLQHVLDRAAQDVCPDLKTVQTEQQNASEQPNTSAVVALELSDEASAQLHKHLDQVWTDAFIWNCVLVELLRLRRNTEYQALLKSLLGKGSVPSIIDSNMQLIMNVHGHSRGAGAGAGAGNPRPQHAKRPRHNSQTQHNRKRNDSSSHSPRKKPSTGGWGAS
jgi:hypothetical protein